MTSADLAFSRAALLGLIALVWGAAILRFLRFLR